MQNLVIGAPNFVAMRLIEALRSRGESVRALVRPGAWETRGDRSRGRLGRFTPPQQRLTELDVETRAVPLSDNAGLASVAEGVERLFYAEWHFQDWGVEALAEQSAARGLRNVLAAATRAHIPRLIYLSTTDVYGFPGEPVRETEQLAPPGLPYADARADAEIAVWEHARRVQLPVTVLRPATVYGPGAQAFVVDLVELLRARRLVLVEDGARVAGLTYVGNLVDAMLLAAHSPAAAGQAYNITDDSPVTWATYIQGLAALAQVPPPTRSYSRGRAMLMAGVWERKGALLGETERPPLTRLLVELMSVDQCYPVDKARRAFNYNPQVSFERGLRETADWMRRVGVIPR